MFDYSDGFLLAKESKGKRKKGTRVGSVNKNGYYHVQIAGHKYLVHRLIWTMHGGGPAEMIDHINGDLLDNRIENLRAVTNSQNLMNSRRRRDNTSGIKGVSWNAGAKRWVGQIMLNRKPYRTKMFKDKQECVAALNKLRRELHGEFARAS